MRKVHKTFEYAGNLLQQWQKNHRQHCARMEAVYQVAKKAAELGETPVAAALWRDDTLLAQSPNRVEELQDSMMHAEYIVIRDAMKAYGLRYLEDCILYVTLEPCAMCAGMLNCVRLGALCYASKAQSVDEAQQVSCPRYVLGGVLQEQCSALLKGFFKERR